MMRSPSLPLHCHLPNPQRAWGETHADTRPRRAEARERGADAPSLSRPAVIPPAHVVARAASESAVLEMAETISSNAAKEHDGGAYGDHGTRKEKTAKEMRRQGNGEKGCKIKGGLARSAQAFEAVGTFATYECGHHLSGLATRAQAPQSIEDLCYPAHRKPKILGKFP